jgi:hypothetical protein
MARSSKAIDRAKGEYPLIITLKLGSSHDKGLGGAMPLSRRPVANGLPSKDKGSVSRGHLLCYQEVDPASECNARPRILGRELGYSEEPSLREALRVALSNQASCLTACRGSLECCKESEIGHG